MKIRNLIAGLLCTAACLTFGGCTADGTSKTNNGEELSVVTTVFPPYDFAKQITGGNAEITTLLSPGEDSHAYEPSPSEIIKIQECDVFIYIGGENEYWAEKLLESTDTSDKKIVKLIDCVTLLEQAEEHGHEDGGEHGGHIYDEHIWTSPANALLMMDMICGALCEAMPAEKEIFKENCEAYCEEIKSLQSDISTAVAQSERKTLVFGDKFPFRYFVDEFGLEYHAAFSSCSEESEPSAAAVAELINVIRDNDIPVVFYKEFSSRKIADSLCEQTGATALLFHSCHNVSDEDLAAGATYVSLMRENLENLKTALA